MTSKFRGFSVPRSSSPKPAVPTLIFHIPAYGVIYVSRPPTIPYHNEPSGSNQLDLPSSDPPLELRGELEIVIPKTYGPRRAKSLRIGLKAIVILDISPERLGEEDEIFRRETKLDGGGEGLFLDIGNHRFEFTLLLPATVAGHDWHPGAKCTLTLYAELEGIPIPENSISSFSKHNGGYGKDHGKDHGHGHGHGHGHTWLPTFGRGRSPSPSQSPKRKGSSQPLDPSSFSFVRPTDPSNHQPSLLLATTESSSSGGGTLSPPILPRAPSYEQSEADLRNNRGNISPGLESPLGDGARLGEGGETPWLEGIWKGKKNIKICRNPNLDGGVSELDFKVSEFVEGWGLYDLVMRSSVLTVGCRLAFSLSIPEPSPSLTIFFIRVSLQQTVTLYSPRDKSPTTTTIHGSKPPPSAVRTRSFPVVELGHPLDMERKRPSRDVPALWRGREAHGKDRDGVEIMGRGRLPNDKLARPSTVKGVVTPLVLSHTLFTEVFFSIWGEDARGQALGHSGPGFLRVLQLKRPIILPSCPIIPQILALPPYPTHPSDDLPQPGHPCPLCHTPVDQKLCLTCPSTNPPHPRHDHPPKLVGNQDGICPLCSADIMPSEDEVGWRNCMCGLSDLELDKLEEKDAWARSACTVPVGMGVMGVQEDGEAYKYEFQRGRRM